MPPAGASSDNVAWRRRLLGLPRSPPSAGAFDLVVVGGGIAGCSAALTAARLGLAVALIQDRPVLGGNASTEIGITPAGIAGPVVEEILTHAGREKVMNAQRGLQLFLGWRAYGVEKAGARIAAVDARSTATAKELRFTAPVFVDATGDGWIGYWAGADFRIGREARSEFKESLAPETADSTIHGHTVVFKTREAAGPVSFPDVPWARAVSRDYATLKGLAHEWEYGQRLDTIAGAEDIRDHLFRAIYGTFSTVKQKHPRKHANLELVSVGYVAARGESRRLLGDYLLNENDIREKRRFPDWAAMGCGVFCLHSPTEEYDFRSTFKLVPVDPYLIPFRCLYSRNVDNLLMAGRDISATHVAYASIKLMQTGGQTGRAAGVAAYLCKTHSTTPRGIYKKHMGELHDVILGRGAHAGKLKAGSVD